MKPYGPYSLKWASLSSSSPWSHTLVVDPRAWQMDPLHIEQKEPLSISKGGHCSPSHLIRVSTFLSSLKTMCSDPMVLEPKLRSWVLPWASHQCILMSNHASQATVRKLESCLGKPLKFIGFKILQGAPRAQSSDGKREHTDSLWQKCYFLTFSSSWRGFISILSRSQNGLCKSKIQPLSKQEWSLEHLAGIWEKGPIWNKTRGARVHWFSTYRAAYFFCG